MEPLVAGAAALALAAVHVFSSRLRFLREVPRSRLLSAGGGISVAYVILRILPSVEASQREIDRAGAAGTLPFVRNHAYGLLLLSVIVFYGLERATKASRRKREQAGEEATSWGVFWLKVGTFAVVNVLIGYVLVRQGGRGLQPLALFTVAMLLKFVVNDHGLHADHRRPYDVVGRWVLAAAVLLGWGIGEAVTIPPVWLAVLQAVIAGSVLLNVLKEELPEYRESRYGAFAAGALAYAVLLLLL